LETLDQKIAGSLYGLLVGDALGWPAEGWSPAKIKHTWGELDRMVDPPDSDRPRGLHSDDGQQALALCDAVLLKPEAPEADFVRIVLELAHDDGSGLADSFGAHRGMSGSFRRSVRDWGTRKVAPSESARPFADNEMAKLIAPIAWYWRDDTEQLARGIVRVARVRERDPRGIAAAGAIGYLVAWGLLHDGSDKFWDHELVKFARDVETRASAELGKSEHTNTFSKTLEQVLSRRGGSRERVLELIAELGTKIMQRPCPPTSPHAVTSVITAIYLSLSSSSFKQALVDAVNLGSDTDTMGAMVGAICGARDSRTAIPAGWYDALLAKNAFEDRIDALVARQAGFVPDVSLYDRERYWSSLTRAGAARSGASRTPR